MRFLYNSRNKMIRELKPDSDYIDLTIMESKLLEALSNDQANTWKEIGMFMYGFYDSYAYLRIKTIKTHLLKKVKLHIENTNTSGLILKDEIYIL